MTDPNTTCPSGWKLTTHSKRTCGRVYSQRYTCDTVIFPVSARAYSRVCGRIKAYQYGYTVAFHNSSIETAYLSGVSITLGILENTSGVFQLGNLSWIMIVMFVRVKITEIVVYPLLLRTTSEAL